MFGYYDKGVFNMMVNKFKKIFEVNESLPNKVTDKFKNLKDKPKSKAQKIFRNNILLQWQMVNKVLMD